MDHYETITQPKKVSSLAFTLISEIIARHNNNSISINDKIYWETFSRVVRVFLGPESRKIILFLFKRRAATTFTLMKETKCTRPTISRTLNNLSLMGVAHKSTNVGEPWHTKKDMGPKPPVWALFDARPDEIIAAQRLHGNHRKLDQNLDVVDHDIVKGIVTLLNRHPEIDAKTINNVIDHTPDIRSNMRKDYRDEVIRELTEDGIKVWG